MPAVGNCAWVARSCRAALNSTALSSAVKLLGTSRVEWNVSRVASPPVAGMTNTSKLPYRSEAKATDVPSWLQTGANSYDSPSVSGTAVPPADGTDQMSPLYSNSSVAPSGEMAGYRSQRGGSWACAAVRQANTRATAMAGFMTCVPFDMVV